MSTTTTEYPCHIPSIPYTSPPTSLQTLSIWLPRPLSDSPPGKTLWIIYLHGGAWRDPLLSSAQLEATVSHLLPEHTTTSQIAGFASINYRLSPYPAHPTHPSSPSDPSRNARHPEHIQDVCAALEFLGKEYRLGEYGWVGVGHSAGATLWTQLVSDLPIGVARPAGGIRAGLKALLLLAGIYDLQLFMENHSSPKVGEGVEKIYRDIITGAFGKDRAKWADASPVHGRYEKDSVWDWEGIRMIVLARSSEDELVEGEQGIVMERVFKSSGWAGEGRAELGREIWVRELRGEHDEVWEDGKQIAGLVAEVLGSLGG